MDKYIINYYKNGRAKIIDTPKFFEIDYDLINKDWNNKLNESIYSKAKYVIFDSRPKQINKTYGEHFEDSIYLAFNSLLAFFIFIIHAIFPILFETKGTEVLKYAIDFSEKNKQK